MEFRPVLVRARRFQITVAVAGIDPHLERIAFAPDLQRHLDARLAERPDLAEAGREFAYLLARHGEHEVAGLQAGTLRRPAFREARDHNAVLDLDAIDAEPRPRRTLCA